MTFEASFKDRSSQLYRVYLVLKDKEWHCRACEYQHLQAGQIAGGGGIQGLQRGSNSRDGMDIESANHFCNECDKTTRHDRWNGHLITATAGSSMPSGFAKKAAACLGQRDVVENVEGPLTQLTLDHKLPNIRWNAHTKIEQTDYSNMEEDDIREKFQLLKKSNGSVSHNQLKSRSCEVCYKTGKRGTPFGIEFFYAGGPKWGPTDKKDPSGCVGCGWYDFDRWRSALNQTTKAARAP